MFACWFRYTLSSLHEFTYHEAIPGVKWVALGSLVIIGTGALVLEKRRFLSRPFYPVALICGLMFVSAVINRIADECVRADHPLCDLRADRSRVVAGARDRGSSVLRRLFLVFIQPLTYQVASIALGVPKSGEARRLAELYRRLLSRGTVLAHRRDMFFVAIFAGGIGKHMRFVICAVALVSICLANYRTTMLGILPLAMIALFTAFQRRSSRASGRLRGS